MAAVLPSAAPKVNSVIICDITLQVIGEGKPEHYQQHPLDGKRIVSEKLAGGGECRNEREENHRHTDILYAKV
jgi:hypothetical protein